MIEGCGADDNRVEGATAFISISQERCYRSVRYFVLEQCSAPRCVNTRPQSGKQKRGKSTPYNVMKVKTKRGR